MTSLLAYQRINFAKYCKEYGVNYTELRRELESYVEDIKNVNNAVYRCGFANTQEAYDLAYKETFEAFDYLENRLSKSRYLFGDILTISDIHLYVTLCRFDVAYYTAFNINKKD